MGHINALLKELVNKYTTLGDAVRDKTGLTEKLTLEEMAQEIAWINGEQDDTLTYVIVDKAGNEFACVATDEIVNIDATPNDIRAGTIAVTANGIITGEKEIPSYRTTEGYIYIPSGRDFTVKIRKGLYDYTKLQALICVFNTNINNSVSTEKVVINDNVYEVNSTEAISEVYRDHENESINLGIMNDSGKPYIFRYITYKEEY